MYECYMNKDTRPDPAARKVRPALPLLQKRILQLPRDSSQSAQRYGRAARECSSMMQSSKQAI